MRVNEKVVSSIENGKVLHREFFEYNGPVEMAGTGPGPHGVKVEYDNVVFVVTGGRITVLVHTKDSQGNPVDKVIAVNQTTGEVE